MDFSLQLLPEQPLADLIEVIRLADELGYRGCYSADETYHKDMWILFGAAAPRMGRLRFGPTRRWSKAGRGGASRAFPAWPARWSSSPPRWRRPWPASNPAQGRGAGLAWP